MKKNLAFLMFCAVGVIASPVVAAKDCEELKTEIAAKLDAKGVVNYTLTIALSDEATEFKIVGVCGGGTKKITYKKG